MQRGGASVLRPKPAWRPAAPPSPRRLELAPCRAGPGVSPVRVRRVEHWAPHAVATQSPARDEAGKCDACDGDHDTAACPVYRRPREAHADAVRSSPAARRKTLGEDSRPVFLRAAHVERQPGDGSCLYHSLCFGLGLFEGGAAAALRRELASWMARNADTELAGSPLREWVLWDSGCSVEAYAARMQRWGEWGGALEMALFARLKSCNVHGAAAADNKGWDAR